MSHFIAILIGLGVGYWLGGKYSIPFWQWVYKTEKKSKKQIIEEYEERMKDFDREMKG